MIIARYDIILDQSVRVLLYNHLSNYTKLLYTANLDKDEALLGGGGESE